MPPACTSPSACPFFYGYIVLGIGIAVKIFKGCGQNNILGYATPDILGDSDAGLSRTGYSSVSSAATLLGALIQPALGILTDRLGGRRVIPVFLLLLALGLWLLAWTSVTLGPMRYALAGMGMTLTRGFAIGGLEQATNTVIAQWFVLRRGRAMAFGNFINTIGQLIFYSQAYQWSIAAWGWKATFRLGATVCAVLAVPAAVLLRRSPESCGCTPDFATGRSSKTYSQLSVTDDDDSGSNQASQREEEWSMTLGEALCTRALWLLCTNALVWGVLGAGFDLHMVSVIAENTPDGVEIDVATTFAAPQAFTSCAFGLISGILVDKGYNVKWLLGASCVALSAFALLCSMPHYTSVNVAMGLTRGIYNGLKGTVTSTVFASFYGRKHVGAISSVFQGCAIVGAAAGPATFAVAREVTGEFITLLRVLTIPPLVIGVLFVTLLRKPEQNLPARAPGEDKEEE